MGITCVPSALGMGTKGYLGGAVGLEWVWRAQGHFLIQEGGLGRGKLGGESALHSDSLCLLQTDQQAEARSYLSEEMIAGE